MAGAEIAAGQAVVGVGASSTWRKGQQLRPAGGKSAGGATATPHVRRPAVAKLEAASTSAAAAAVTAFVAAGPALADVGAATGGGLPLPLLLVAGGAAAAGVIVAADPQKRRQAQAAATGGDEMAVVRNYFDTTGFERWRKIYGETDDVNKVQLDIRVGHAQTVEKVLKWLREEDAIVGKTICDAGCGTGSLSIPLALEGAKVFGSDISSSMAGEAARRADAAIAQASDSKAVKPSFEAKDLESITGKYDVVSCLDVLIHYPQDKAAGMISHLASLAEERLIISFAPKTFYYTILKRIGELFPGPSKATRAYLHAEADVEAALKAAGWEVTRREMTATSFYFSRLLEARPARR
eukprot:jgi/Chlat1/8864/Chrsp91S08175